MHTPFIFFSVLAGVYFIFVHCEVDEKKPAATEDKKDTAVTEKPATCEKDLACFTHNDCNGGSCMPEAGAIPAWLGTCDCSACFPKRNGWRCESDADCGGLKTACNMKTKLCDCVTTGINQAKEQNTTINKILTDFCNKQKCDASNQDEICNGLPCRTGKCNCNIKPKA